MWNPSPQNAHINVQQSEAVVVAFLPKRVPMPGPEDGCDPSKVPVPLQVLPLQVRRKALEQRFSSFNYRPTGGKSDINKANNLVWVKALFPLLVDFADIKASCLGRKPIELMNPPW